MIVRPRPTLLTVMFALRGSILPQVAPTVIGLTVFSVGVTAAEQRWPWAFPVTAGAGPFTLIGLALSIFLSFRNNACYDRWWEARKVWGSLIVEARGLARTIPALLPGEEHAALRRACLLRVAAFTSALHAGLREGDEAKAAAAWLPGADEAALRGRPSPADATLALILADLAAAMRRGALTDVLLGLLERKVADLSALHTACERIRHTPVPFAYTLLVYRTAWLYCLFLPVGLSGSLGWATPPAVALVAYTFFGLDALGDELEEPFGTAPNDLPMDAMLRTVERTVLDALGDPLPPAIAPDRYWLR
ncbi:bestrophin family protein [Methylobacterium sp. J-076]|uniref:bestrophin family protein n=1 Tax=Methylobacterium sp. J-076 TaxID=2836655 RepID=UPI001FB9BA2F|nr:bestrophin family ion channel [Methylobacterium sp. J-076]MCJ2014099.1 bestrophin [Methylobacterium sp. J-076]